MSAGNCVIVGASHAGVSLALALRKEGWSGQISLVGAENELPYHRPPLSKEHLSGGKDLDAMRLRPEKIYQDNEIQLLLGRTALQIDSSAQKISLQSGESLSYDKLALCTGASVRKLPLGQGLSQVHYLRTAADVSLIKQQVGNAKSVVIIGGGYIGLEAAAVLCGLGLQVTVLEMADRILSRVTGEAMSDFMTSLHMMHDVTIKTSTKVVSIEAGSEPGAPVIVGCNEDEKLQTDFVLVGVGVDPNVEIAEAAGLTVSNGIVVNEHAQTSDPNIYAAGDCTQHPSALYKRELRLESVQNANDQARVAAANICGKELIYDAVPWFWSDQYDVKLQMAGLNDGYDEVIVRGDPQNADEGFAVFYLRSGNLLATDCVKRPKEFMVSKLLLEQKKALDPKLFADEGSDPMSWKDMS